MTKKYERTMVMLTEEQKSKLREIANKKNGSMAYVMRSVLDTWLCQRYDEIMGE